jgi:AraC-like DNA-binding protein
MHGDCPDVLTASGQVLSGSPFPATGPSSQAVKFTVGSARMWGIGLLPLGWAKFVHAPAASLANAAVDGNTHPAFASFVPLARSLFGKKPDVEGELARITRHFLDRLGEPVADEKRILAIHTALVDSDVGTASELVARAGISQRTTERLCQRAFGFAPKLLLRRQRFMRSLTDFMLDPSLKWIGAIDSHYHDQAQFVRDFRQFMGMSPRQYAALPKPLIAAIVKARDQLAGSAAQTLDGPGGSRLRP